MEIKKSTRNNGVRDQRVDQRAVDPVLFPPPEAMEKYEAIMPGFAERIVLRTEKQTAHRIDIERKLIISGIWKSFLGLVFGFLIGIAGIGGGFYLTALGFNVLGLILSSATLVSLVMAFIYGSQNKKNGHGQNGTVNKHTEGTGT
jgi:uncharacterized membrane protein